MKELAQAPSAVEAPTKRGRTIALTASLICAIGVAGGFIVSAKYTELQRQSGIHATTLLTLGVAAGVAVAVGFARLVADALEGRAPGAAGRGLLAAMSALAGGSYIYGLGYMNGDSAWVLPVIATLFTAMTMILLIGLAAVLVSSARAARRTPRGSWSSDRRSHTRARARDQAD